VSRRLRYGVAVSLDGFIAGPNGEYDWIVMDPAIDFAAMYRDYDTAVMGRKTYEVMAAMGGEQAGSMPGIEVVVFSKSLEPVKRPGFRIVPDDPVKVVKALKKKQPLKIWVDIGTKESDGSQETVDDARSLRDALVADGWVEGKDLKYTEVAGAIHTETAWADRIDQILKYLYPPAGRQASP